MTDPNVVSVISPLTALAASITGPIVTLYVARSQIRATVRSANRQKWIEEFRDLIASFCGQIVTAAQVRERIVSDGRLSIPIESELLHHFERIVFTATKIRLMVNPIAREHQELLATIDDLLTRFRTARPDEDAQAEARDKVRHITEMSLAIVRHEWRRVQKGA